MVDHRLQEHGCPHVRHAGHAPVAAVDAVLDSRQLPRAGGRGCLGRVRPPRAAAHVVRPQHEVPLGGHVRVDQLLFQLVDRVDQRAVGGARQRRAAAHAVERSVERNDGAEFIAAARRVEKEGRAQRGYIRGRFLAAARRGEQYKRALPSHVVALCAVLALCPLGRCACFRSMRLDGRPRDVHAMLLLSTRAAHAMMLPRPRVLQWRER